MKPVARIAIIVILATLCSYACKGAELIEVTAAVDKQSAYIGDLINYSIIITCDSTVELTPPPAGANLGGFEVKDYDFGVDEKLDDGRRRQIIQFQLRTFTTGDYVIPALPIEYKISGSEYKYISADPIKINIKSLLGEGETTDSLQPRPLKEQVSFSGRSWTFWLILGLIVAAVAAGVIYYFTRRKEEIEKAPYVDPRPSWEIAFADLAILKEKDLPGQGEVKQFYFELSEIIKRYLGKKFEFDSVDMTTSEVDNALSVRSIDEVIHKDLIVFFDHADLVKFAKYVPSTDRPDSDWDTAYDLVVRSKDLIVSRPVSAEPEPAMVAAVEGGSDGDDSELRFAPPELREYFSSNEEEDER